MPIPPYAPMHPFMVTLPPRTMLTTPDNSCSSAMPATVPQVLTQSAAQQSVPVTVSRREKHMPGHGVDADLDDHAEALAAVFDVATYSPSSGETPIAVGRTRTPRPHPKDQQFCRLVIFCSVICPAQSQLVAGEGFEPS